MRRRLLWMIPLLLVVVAGGWSLRVLWLAGAFRRIHPHFAGSCRLVRGPVGPEDITIHPRTGVAYISASDRRAVDAGRPVPGGIHAYDLNAEAPVPVNLTPDADAAFQPHGISLWVGKDGHDVLFVVNHPAGATVPHANTVEIFDLSGGALVHRATLTDPLLVMPNDLVAVGVDRFYVTNTHHHPPGTMQTIETYLLLSGAQVLFYGDGGFRPVLDDVIVPNGINVSPDGRTLYIASTTGRVLRMYDRDPAAERLAFRKEVFLGSGPDNIEIDEQGDLWIGSHPKLLRIDKHRADPAELSPSQVLRVTKEGKVDEVYLDDGRKLSGASVAAVRGRRLLIGEIFDDGFLDCEMAGGGA
jgi:arylesterase/paraoxonase